MHSTPFIRIHDIIRLKARLFRRQIAKAKICRIKKIYLQISLENKIGILIEKKIVIISHNI